MIRGIQLRFLRVLRLQDATARDLGLPAGADGTLPELRRVAGIFHEDSPSWDHFEGALDVLMGRLKGIFSWSLVELNEFY